MNSSVETYQKRLRDEVSLVEQDIESHNQQIETLNTRLGGLKRALSSAILSNLRLLNCCGLEYPVWSLPPRNRQEHRPLLRRGQRRIVRQCRCGGSPPRRCEMLNGVAK